MANRIITPAEMLRLLCEDQEKAMNSAFKTCGKCGSAENVRADARTCPGCGATYTMTMYRPQRGGLEESMAEVDLARSLEDLERLTGLPIVAVKDYDCFDARCGWQTYIVIARFPDGTEGAVGFTNGPAPEP